jgi:hypothetical protein
MTAATPVRAADSTTEVVVEQIATPMPRNSDVTYGVGRLCDATTAASVILTPLSSAVREGSTVSVPVAGLIPVSDSLPPETALLAPAVARALWMWDAMELELGELAVVTDGHPFSSLAATVSRWYGAEPMLLGANGIGGTYTYAGAEYPASALPAALRSAPGVAAAELSGATELLDVLLEALPAFARLMLAGARGETVTIDFYVNVHRKGLTMLSGILEPLASFSSQSEIERVERALRLLTRPARAAECRAAMSAQISTGGR